MRRRARQRTRPWTRRCWKKARRTSPSASSTSWPCGRPTLSWTRCSRSGRPPTWTCGARAQGLTTRARMWTPAEGYRRRYAGAWLSRACPCWAR
ncbi:hypothetical protein F751_5734 [Auxenochlorella protothecoides]|uniref:Uncharacterized protein n=1 Tax=Auxenochlorella protothecoides TaxID=3075 RepID=A0A087SS02_AUXPR|nr:hypothetical protein F751_5734 [Auxenochlorella protothecoides]KFM28506.1 hypothetical protein F751_5734 [Auxenochlorella protothecoides]